MGAGDLPEAVRRLILRCIDSAEDLEIVLLLERTRERAWRPAEVSGELRTQEDSSAAALRKLADAGLLAADGDGGFRFSPRDRGLDAAVEALVDAYARRRVSVIQFLYRKPNDRITTFADAFQIRRRR